MRRRRRSPLDNDDLLSEILLRLPPQPSSLPRASLVCKRWRGLASDPGFCRRHRRNPPLLGLFDSHPIVPFLPTLEAPNRVSPGRFSLQLSDSRHVRSLGCRHGLALYFDCVLPQLLVWDPIHGDQRCIALPPGFDAERALIDGAVLRAAGDAHFQFQVVLAGALDDDDAAAAEGVYSSETGVWGNLFSTLITAERYVNLGPAVLVGDSVYWILVTSPGRILEFDLKMQSLATIQLPVDMLEYCRLMPVRAGGGGLGLFLVSNFTAQLWKRKTDCNGVASWGLGRTVALDELLSLNSEFAYLISILGYAEENNLVFLATADGVFMIQLESLQFTKLSGNVIFPRHHPFKSVYTTGNSISNMHSHFGYNKTKLILYNCLMVLPFTSFCVKS
ncbi:hypothetical protein CFC21_086579 [Triticum aestivum]|uniref:F-box domain-containing protein n=2 Tax=Triticum aestivum TaxID=4565 RepID=A0A9R1L9L8_WHEAT|nr:hypothetical protein CFC21_086579 [Triticum aestivum]